MKKHFAMNHKDDWQEYVQTGKFNIRLSRSRNTGKKVVKKVVKNPIVSNHDQEILSSGFVKEKKLLSKKNLKISSDIAKKNDSKQIDLDHKIINYYFNQYDMISIFRYNFCNEVVQPELLNRDRLDINIYITIICITIQIINKPMNLSYAYKHFTESGMGFTAIDSSQISFVSAHIDHEDFQEYICKQETTIGINSLNVILTSSTNGNSTRYTIRLLDIDQEHITIPEVAYNVFVEISSDEFKRICQDQMVVGDSVTINTERETGVIRLSSVNETGDECITTLKESSDTTDDNITITIRDNRPPTSTGTLDFIIQSKTRYDAFYKTELDSLLTSLGIKTLIIYGVKTNLCCETTARSEYLS
ncbi:8812_t:CDS:2 [Racocetra fulgida]|uniref:8812_t:CDS:1 n=1 Tax=Racocetra fulgida TaxID=60492 RepID=A0A9N8ZRN8_9GLOM|nr:8812_t:CDS:2 [Racocetra fulgida]